MIIQVSDSVRLYVEDRGQGRPLVLIHAWTLSGRMWENQVAAMAGSARVVVPDFRGHGQSSKDDGAYDIPAHADDVAALLAALRLEGVTLVGWSMGVTVCLEYMRRHRGARVAKLGLVCGSPYLINTPDWNHGFDTAVMEGLGQAMAADRAHTTAEFYGSLVHKKSPELVAWITRQSLDVPLIAAMESFQSEMGWDCRPILPDIRVPTLILSGDRDHPAATGGSAYMAEHVPGARHVRFADSGHFPMLEEAAAFSAALSSFHAE